MIRAKAEEAIGKEMADEGEAEDPAKGAEIAKREGQVEDVFIGTQNSNGKPFAVITCKGNKDAERLLYAHSCGGGALRGVLGKWARFVAGEPRHQREARRKVKEGMRPGVRGGGEGGGGGVAGGGGMSYSEAVGGQGVSQEGIQALIAAAVQKALEARDAADRLRAKAEAQARMESEARIKAAVTKALIGQKAAIVSVINSRMMQLGQQLQEMTMALSAMGGWVHPEGMEDEEDEEVAMTGDMLADLAGKGSVAAAEMHQEVMNSAAAAECYELVNQQGFTGEDAEKQLEQMVMTPVRLPKKTLMSTASGAKGGVAEEGVRQFILKAIGGLSEEEMVQAMVGAGGDREERRAMGRKGLAGR